MGSSLRLGRFFGIDLLVHWTFALLFVYVAGVYVANGEPVAASLGAMGLVLATFACWLCCVSRCSISARR